MSKSVTNHQRTPSRAIINQLREITSQAARSRTLQLQGNQALGLAVIDGYFAITIPTTIEPSVASVDVVAPTGSTILVGNLMYTVFYPVNVGGASPSGYVYDNMDVGNFYPTRLTWECFLAYDSRAKGAGSLANEAAVIATAVESNVARITARISANGPWSLPAGASTTAYIYYQIRATLM